MRSRLLALVVFIGACHTSPAEPPSPPPPPLPASAPAVVAVDAAPPPAVIVEDAGPMEERTFREVMVGLLPRNGRRLTWVLGRSSTRVSLRLACQKSVGHPKNLRGLRLDGAENQASFWGEAASIEFAGPVNGGLTYELAKTSAATPEECRPYQGSAQVTLLCKEAKVDALPAGAVLLGRARWKPAARESISALRCDLVEHGAAPPAHDATDFRDHSLAFASRPLEWAEENSDMVAQAGAYRLLAP